MNDKDITISRPRADCKYCDIRNFVDFQGNPLDSCYAQCLNKEKTGGMTCIDITFDGNPFMCEVSCQNCGQYENKAQMRLF